MAEIFDEEEVTLDMVQWWWANLSRTAIDILEDRYAKRYDHGTPRIPPHEDDLDWYVEEYGDAIREFCNPRDFLVIGYYNECQQRFSQSAEARTPREAELIVLDEINDYDLCICGVVDFSKPEEMADAYYSSYVSSIANPPDSQPE